MLLKIVSKVKIISYYIFLVHSRHFLKVLYEEKAKIGHFKLVFSWPWMDIKFGSIKKTLILSMKIISWKFQIPRLSLHNSMKYYLLAPGLSNHISKFWSQNFSIKMWSLFYLKISFKVCSQSLGAIFGLKVWFLHLV